MFCGNHRTYLDPPLIVLTTSLNTEASILRLPVQSVQHSWLQRLHRSTNKKTAVAFLLIKHFHLILFLNKSNITMLYWHKMCSSEAMMKLIYSIVTSKYQIHYISNLHQKFSCKYFTLNPVFLFDKHYN